MDIYEHNSKAWDENVRRGSKYTVACSDEEIEKARSGDVRVKVTDFKFVPREWLPTTMTDIKFLLLASGGGQQSGILAAAGANVTVLDNSVLQLEEDKKIAEKHNLAIKTIKGNMIDLSVFENESFDVVINPMSSHFIPDVSLMYKEVNRVLKKGGTFITGFFNPLRFLLNASDLEKGILTISESVPFSIYNTENEKLKQIISRLGMPLTFGHTLDDLIGGQIRNGFNITGFYEDKVELECINKHIDITLATCAKKI